VATPADQRANVEKIAALLGNSEGAAVALRLCREAMRAQNDAIKMGRYVIEKVRHEEL
jgi:hypothetical protein